MIVTALRAAAQVVRNMASADEHPTEAHKVTILASIARAVTRGDAAAAEALHSGCAVARPFIMFVGRVPRLACPEAFDREFATLRAAQLADAINSAARTPSADKRPPSASAGLTRQLRLWSKSHPAVRGVIDAESGAVHIDLDGKMRTLAEHWRQVFQERPVDGAAQNALAAAAADYPLPFVAPPSKDSMLATLRRARVSAPGSDGLPATAWQACPEIGVEHDCATLHWLLSGLHMPSDWSASVLACVPKNVLLEKIKPCDLLNIFVLSLSAKRFAD